MRYAREVHFQIKSGKTDEFNRVMDRDVVPLLRQQKGLKEVLTLVRKDHGIGISVWEDRPSAERYETSGYPQVLRKLDPVIEGTPKVETFDVPTLLINN